MNCPACGKEMIEKDFGGVKVDVCENGCKSIWFDLHELTKLDETNEGAGEALFDAIDDSRTNDEGREALACPKCSMPMHIHKYHSSKEVNIDECYACGGIFLDSGELSAIRDNFMTEVERTAYCAKVVGEINGYAEHVNDVEGRKLRADAMMKATKFLRPISAYNKRTEASREAENKAKIDNLKNIAEEHNDNN